MFLRRTLRSFSAVLVSLLFIVAACGGDSDSGDSNADESSSTTAANSDGGATTTEASGGSDTGGDSDGSDTTEPMAAPTETLTIAINGDPQSLDPGRNGGGPQQAVQFLSYEPLIRSMPDGSYQPGLAESWEYVGDDNTVFQMTLREGAVFADGSPVTVEAVVDSIEYFRASESPLSSLIETVTGVEAIDDMTVQVTFSQSNPSARTLFSQQTNYGDIISPAGLADPDQLGTQTFGAGPYVLDPSDTVSGDRYTFVLNENYWNPSAQHWAKVVVRIIGDANTALNAVRTGQINISTVTAPSQLPEAQSAGLDILGGGELPIVVWMMDRNGEKQPALADVRVRQALNMAIDRELIATALGEAYSPLSQFGAPGGDAYVDSREPIAYDPEGAKALLAEAGYPDGFDFALATNTDNRDAEVSQILVEQFAAIGVNTDLVTYDNQPGEMFGAISEGVHQAITFAVNTTLPTYEALLTRQSVFNPFAASDPDVEAAFAAWAVAPPEEVDAAAENVATLINDLHWFVPVASVGSFFVSQGVDNLGTLSSTGLYDVLSWTPSAG